MDLYQPLFVPRPVVEPELFASLRPPTYSGAMDRPTDALTEGDKDGGRGGKQGGGREFFRKRGAAKIPAPKSEPAAKEVEEAAPQLEALRRLDETPLRLGQSVGTAASASKLGDFFRYVIDKPVALARQKSAMLPIVTNDVEGTRASIYNEATQAKFPLLGLKFKNTSGVHLMQGPITVFEGSNYAGDSRILDLQPNEERLLSFAVDLGTEVNAVPSSDNGRITMVKAVKGLIESTTKVRETKTYTIKNRNDVDRLVLIEHPVRNDFKLVDTDKPTETASDFYRFEVKVAPNKAEKQIVTEEHVIGQTIAITNLNDDTIRYFIGQPVTSAKVKQGLTQAMELRWAVAKTQRDIQELERQLKVIVDDQVRLRANLKEMPPTAEAYKRYLKKFDDQETQIEKYQADIKKLQGVEFNQKKELDEFLASFSAE
jgi:hypothetical protein